MTASNSQITLAEHEWTARAQAHHDRVEPWVANRLARRSVGQSHAVWDFLFDYYPYSPAKLARWHPGFGIALLGPSARRYLSDKHYREADGRVMVEAAMGPTQRRRLDLAIAVLRGTSTRPPGVGCFALHEWAMVYGLTQDEVRHPYLPLRVTPNVVAATVEGIGLRCTHIDAFRFFTADAIPRNEYEPTRASQPADEQPGCLHAAMDLYKYASWFAPLTGSDLVADCFENAARARELDMRASPYDVSGFGLTPVRVETSVGRREYMALQRDLIARTDPLRRRLLAVLEGVRSASPVRVGTD